MLLSLLWTFVHLGYVSVDIGPVALSSVNDQMTVKFYRSRHSMVYLEDTIHISAI